MSYVENILGNVQNYMIYKNDVIHIPMQLKNNINHIVLYVQCTYISHLLT
jgi:hypothetical protein